MNTIAALCLLVTPGVAAELVPDKPPTLAAVIDIGSRRELFVDDYLIASMEGADLKVQQPQPQEVVFTTDAPWEGNTSAYFTVFQDGDLYRMYYRGSALRCRIRKRQCHPK